MSAWSAQDTSVSGCDEKQLDSDSDERIGGPTAAILALHNPGITVEVLDRDPRRIQQWQSPHLPVHEPGLDTVVRIVRDGAQIAGDAAASQRKRNLYFTCESARALGQADLILMSVNTPTKLFGVGAGRATNMAAFDGAMRDVAKYAKPGAIIVEKSTVPGGTAERVRKMVIPPAIVVSRMPEMLTDIAGNSTTRNPVRGPLQS